MTIRRLLLAVMAIGFLVFVGYGITYLLTKSQQPAPHTGNTKTVTANTLTYPGKPVKITAVLSYNNDGTFSPNPLRLASRKEIGVQIINRSDHDIKISTKENYPMIDLGVLHPNEDRVVNLSIPGTYHIANTLTATETAEIDFLAK